MIGAPVTLSGQIVPGSVAWDAQRFDLHFGVTDGSTQIAVHATDACR